MKISKGKGPLHRETHTADTKYGTGDYYGTGSSAKIGRIRTEDGVVQIPVAKKKLKIPPRNLA